MTQIDLFKLEPEFGKPVKIKNGEYIYFLNFYDISNVDKYVKRLINDIKWKQESMNIFGKQIPFPRLTSWYADNNKPYSFSDIN